MVCLDFHFPTEQTQNLPHHCHFFLVEYIQNSSCCYYLFRSKLHCILKFQKMCHEEMLFLASKMKDAHQLTCENLGVKVCMEWRRGLTWIQKEVLTQELVLQNHWAKSVLCDWSPITITGRTKQRRQPSSTSQPHPYALQLHWPQPERLWGSALDFSELKILWTWKRKRILHGNLL